MSKKIKKHALKIGSLLATGLLCAGCAIQTPIMANAGYYTTGLSLEFIPSGRASLLPTEGYELVTLQESGTNYFTIDTQYNTSFCIAPKYATYTRTEGTYGSGLYTVRESWLSWWKSNTAQAFLKLANQAGDINASSVPWAFAYTTINQREGFYWFGDFPPFTAQGIEPSPQNITFYDTIGEYDFRPLRVWYAQGIAYNNGQFIFDMNGKYGTYMNWVANRVAAMLPTNWAVTQEGYEGGYQAGYKQGKEESNTAEYNRGFYDGQQSANDATSAILTLFGAVANVPISILNGLGGLAIWDTAIISILITLLMIAIIIYIAKRFIS